MAMAKTASLKNTVRSMSVPLSVQCSSDPLIRVSFSLAKLYILDFQRARSEDYLYSPHCREGGVFETSCEEPVLRGESGLPLFPLALSQTHAVAKSARVLQWLTITTGGG